MFLNIFMGVFAFLGLLLVGGIILVILFGESIEKKWELEAKFRNPAGKEFGEFELSVEKKTKTETSFTMEIEFDMKHVELKPGSDITVQVEDQIFVESKVDTEGRIRFRKKVPEESFAKPEVGQMCKVLCNGTLLAEAPLQPD